MEPKSSFHVGIVGTFDVENYGDLLFPLIAEAELRARLGDVRITAFSYHARNCAAWPYDVVSVADLPNVVGSLDALLIGGGFLIRFDKYVAPGYGPPDSSIHHPTGYWLTPALVAQQSGVPVVWNAPGMHCNDIPSWAEPILRLAIDGSAYVAVRDEPSREALARYATGGDVIAVPDTGFGIAHIAEPNAARARAALDAAGVTKPYIVVQASTSQTWVGPFMKRHAAILADYQLVSIAISPVFGETPSALGDSWPTANLGDCSDPLLMAGLIAGASGVIGHSYHLAITALTAGVPVFTPVDLDEGKYTVLRAFDNVHRVSDVRAKPPQWFKTRLGKSGASVAPALRDALQRVDAHWNRVGRVIREGKTPTTHAPIGKFWQTLPAMLEGSGEGSSRGSWRPRLRRFAQLASWLYALAKIR